jgi:hypothetical protein
VLLCIPFGLDKKKNPLPMHNDAFLTLIHLEIIAIFSNTVTGTHRSPQDNKTNINQILGSTNSYLW